MNRTDLLKAILSKKGVKWLDSAKTIFQLDYIESSGTQYIDTGVCIDNNTGITLKCSIEKIGSGTGAYACGVYPYSNGRYAPMLTDTSYPNKFLFIDSVSFATKEYANYDTNIHTFSFNYPNRNITFDNVLVQETAGTFATAKSTITMTLFARNGLNGTEVDLSNVGKIKMCLCKIYDNDTIIRSFLPAYNTANNSVGMYDTINGVWYGNSGTGVFNGNLKGYEICEYIESSGTEYIDTGLVPNNDSFSLKFQMTELRSVASYVMFGSRTSGAYNTSNNQIYLNILTATQELYLLNNYNVNNLNLIYPHLNPMEYTDIINSNYVMVEPTQPIYLFALNNKGSASAFSKMKLYYWKYGSNIYLIPVKKDNEYFMLDIYSLKEYHNAGTGSFIGN